MRSNFSEPEFRRELLSWYKANKRALPWRDQSDAWPVWLSEIMLQQTRVDQATPYYNRFIEAFPTLHDLAMAPQQELMKLWEGLGYYSRARNLHAAAKLVSDNFNGRIPDTMDQIRTLPGVGPYTAAAVLSIAYGKPYAVVDGNVIRVLTRYAGIDGDIRTSPVRTEVEELAGILLDRDNPGDFNQAMMELGATVCKPRNPLCSSCPVQAGCLAYQTARTDSIPWKSPKKPIPHYQIATGIIRNDEGRLLIALRPDDAMLGGLWEFPGGKQQDGESLEETVRRELHEELGVDVEVTGFLMSLNHAYSHFRITLHAFFCRIIEGSPEPLASRQLAWVLPAELAGYPFPKANRVLTLALMEQASEQ